MIRLLCIAAVLLVSGCESYARQEHSDRHSSVTKAALSRQLDRPVVVAGTEIDLTHDQTWRLVTWDKKKISLGTMLSEAQKYTRAIQVVVLDPPPFTSKESKDSFYPAAEAWAERTFHVDDLLSFSMRRRIFSGANCVETSSTQVKESTFRFSAVRLVCRHPADEDQVIGIEYSEQILAQHGLTDVMPRAEATLERLSFIK